jgi:hypothetical protein
VPTLVVLEASDVRSFQQLSTATSSPILNSTIALFYISVEPPLRGFDAECDHCSHEFE